MICINIFINRDNDLVVEKLFCFDYLNRNNLVITYLPFFRLDFHLVVTRFCPALFLIYKGKQFQLRKPLLLIYDIKRNNLVVRYYLLNILFFIRLLVLVIIHCVSNFNRFHLLGNVLDFTCVCYFICLNMFFQCVMSKLLATIYKFSTLCYHVMHFSFEMENNNIILAC